MSTICWNTTLTGFFSQQRSLEQNCDASHSLLAGYVLEAGYESFTVSSNTAMQYTSGALTRGMFLLAMSRPDQAVLLRVQEVTPSPLRGMENQTNYEMSKRAMPHLDAYTDADLSWTCYLCDVLGAFYEMDQQIFFSGDLPGLSAPKEYRVYQPGELLSLLVNGLYAGDDFGGFRALEYRGSSAGPACTPWGSYPPIGTYRPTEFHGGGVSLPVLVDLLDLAGRRTALFGKTRAGKSNTVKVIASALLNWNIQAQRLGQIIIDTNGEYANDNSQDGRCLRSRFPGECVVYAVHPKPGTSASVLRCNFYLAPEQAMGIFQSQLPKSTYIQAFLNASVPTLEEIAVMQPGGSYTRALRRLQLYWAILYEGGYQVNEPTLLATAPRIHSGASPFDPCFSTALREAVHGNNPPAIRSLAEMTAEWKAVYHFYLAHPDSKHLKTTSGSSLLDSDDLNMLKFLAPGGVCSGTKALSVCRNLHSKDAVHFLREIPALLDRCKTVILDLSNAEPFLISFLVDQICTEVFRHQEQLFTENLLGDHYVQLYAEEAHNYFPAKDTDNSGIFSRIAKEGAKYHIGLIYSTQSPSTISGELLSQTENFVVAHLDSSHEVDALVRRSAPFAGVGKNILRTRTPGYVHLLTASQRYPIPVQIANFQEVV